MIDFEELAAQRHSCRAFLPREVDPTLIRQIVTTAQRTASWCNAQPWRLVVTRGEATEQFRRMYAEAAVSQPPRPDFTFPAKYNGVYLDRR